MCFLPRWGVIFHLPAQQLLQVQIFSPGVLGPVLGPVSQPPAVAVIWAGHLGMGPNGEMGPNL